MHAPVAARRSGWRALLDRPRLARWFYGYRAPERGTVVLGHRRVYIVPTRLGWMFGATLGLLLVGAINYALSLGFVLTFLLAGLGLAGMVHTTRNLARLAISAGRVEPVFAGESAQFRRSLTAGSRSTGRRSWSGTSAPARSWSPMCRQASSRKWCSACRRRAAVGSTSVA